MRKIATIVLNSIFRTAGFGQNLLRCSLQIFALTVILSGVCAAAQISVRVYDGNDDAEERGNAPGSMSRSSTDLELNYDGSNRQVIGIRFQNVSVPAGATINSAYIQFTTDEVDTGTTNVVIYGEDADNPLAYSNTSGDISDRDKTSESETWSISTWNSIGQTHDSPDLTRIVQEIVNRSGWAQNNSMAFIIEPAASCNSSACQRTAESYNGSNSSAPLLVIDYDASVGNHADWRFDEVSWNGMADEVNDSSSNAFHGTASSMTTTSGQICQAGDYSADSASDYVVLDNDGLDGLNDFSISAWIKTNTATYSAVLSGANASVNASNEVLMWFPTGTQFEPWIQGTRGSTIPTTNIADDQWHHAVWTRSGAQNCFYLDGTLQGCASLPTGAVDIDAGGLIIGQDQDSLGGSFELSQNWQGLIDELLIFDGSLDSASVQSIYTNQLAGNDWNGTSRTCPVVSNLAAEWRLDETSWNGTADEVTDSSGSANHGVALSGVQTMTAGQVCGAADIPANSTDSDQEAIDTGVDINDEIGNAGTISFWYKGNTAWTGGGDRALFDASLNPYYFYLMLQDNGELRFGLEDTNDLDIQIDTAAQTFAADEWVHIAVTWDYASDSFQIFINGSLLVTDNSNTNGAMGELDTLYLGDNRGNYHFGGTGNSANGGIDEWLLFNQVLTATEIDSIYQNQLAGNNSDGTSRTCPVTPNLNADWHLDELNWNGTTGEVEDSSGNNFNGTAANGAVTDSSDPAIAGSPGTCNYGNFDGVDQKVEVPYDADLNPDSFTVAFWARVDGGSGTWRSPVTSRWEETDGSLRRGYNVYAGTDNNWQFWTGEGIASWDVLTGPAVVEGTWTHIAVTFEVTATTSGIHTGTKTLYVDGLEVAQNTANYQPNISDPLYIGAGGVSGTEYYFNGAVDEMRVYDQSLDQSAIAAIMAETRDCAVQSSLAEWRLDEASWDGTADEVVDSSGNGNHGVTLTGVQATTSGQICGAADIPSNSTDSEQEAIDTGVDVDDDIGNMGTISLWYKSNTDWSGGGDRALFDASLNPYYFYLMLRTNGELRFGLEDTNDLDLQIDSAAQTFSSGAWVHIAVTWDYSADSFQVFINGSLAATDNTDTNAVMGEFDTLYLGDNRETYHPGSTANSANGALDEWLVFQQALSASEINSIYQNQLAGNNWDGTARVCPTLSDIAFGFNCVESGLDPLTGNLYTKTVGQSFSFDVVALKDGDSDGAADAVETDYANSADRTVTVELIDTGSAAACSAYPALSPAVSQALVFTASDAGRKASAAMSTNVAYRSVGCRVSDNTDIASPVVGCSTDSFAARPTAIAVSSNMTNSGSSGAPTAIAGANFTMTATAIAGYDGTPGLDSGKLEAHAAASRTGVISGTFGSANSATGIATAANFTYDEVGNFRYLAEGVFDASFTAIDQAGDCTDDFSNTVVGGKVGCKFGNTSATNYFGRFIPDHFTLSAGFITNRIDRACTALSNFTYMDEYFQTVFTLSARNLAGNTTQNYTGAYAKLDPTATSNFDFTALNIDSGVTNLTGRLNTRSSTGLWVNGIAGNITADLAVTRLANPDGAYAAINVGINPVDSDGVTLNSFDLDEDSDTVDDHAAVGQTDVRYGRLNIANAHGSELLTLPVPLTAQYYSDSGIGFVTNTDDSCTAIAIGNLTLSNGVETGQTDGDIAIQTSPSITTQATIANTILAAGDAALTFCPPGNPACTPAAGNTGYVDIEVATPSYLQFDWFGAGLGNPKARASFGLFKGRGSQIFMREVY